jgi:hypothetical protein
MPRLFFFVRLRFKRRARRAVPLSSNRGSMEVFGFGTGDAGSGRFLGGRGLGNGAKVRK